MRLTDLLAVCASDLEVCVWRHKDDLFLGTTADDKEGIDKAYGECVVTRILPTDKGYTMDVVILTDKDGGQR